MNDNNNYNLEPSDYLASISPDGSGATSSQKKQRLSNPLLIIGVVLAVIVAITVTTLGILGTTNRVKQQIEEENSQDTGFKEVTIERDLPQLGNNYEALGPYNDGIVIAKQKKDDTIVFLDQNLSVIGELDQTKYDLVSYSFHDGRLLVLCYGESGGKRGFLDTHGNLAIDCKYTSASDFKDGISLFEDIEPLGNIENGIMTYRISSGKLDTSGNTIDVSEETVQKPVSTSM